jgi:hypothetical protein
MRDIAYALLAGAPNVRSPKEKLGLIPGNSGYDAASDEQTMFGKSPSRAEGPAISFSWIMEIY